MRKLSRGQKLVAKRLRDEGPQDPQDLYKLLGMVRARWCWRQHPTPVHRLVAFGLARIRTDGKAEATDKLRSLTAPPRPRRLLDIGPGWNWVDPLDAA